jgi:hypothetical protein
MVDWELTKSTMLEENFSIVFSGSALRMIKSRSRRTAILVPVVDFQVIRGWQASAILQ